MKWEYRIPQRSIVECRLCDKLRFEHFALLWYLRGWAGYPAAKRISENGRSFFWVSYERAILENPMLFPTTANARTNTNRMCKLVKRLRSADLIETQRHSSDLYFFLTQKAVALYRREDSKNHLTKNSEMAVTQKCESPLTKECEPSNGSIIKETGIKEPMEREKAPVVPQGDDLISEEALKETILRCLADTPERSLTKDEQRALIRHMPTMSAKDCWSLEKFYQLPRLLDLENPGLSIRKWRFATIVADLPAQIAMARQQCPPPRPPKPEPPLEQVHAWMAQVYPTATPCKFSELHESGKKRFLADHPQFKFASE